MNGNSKSKAYYDEAERLYVREGKTQREIAAFFKISEKTISAWSAKGEWVRQRQEYLTKTQIAPIAKLETARARLLERLEVGELEGDPKIADRLSKITAVLESMRGKRDPLGAAIEVMDKFTEYVRRVSQDADFVSRVGDMIAGYFEEVRRNA